MLPIRNILSGVVSILCIFTSFFPTNAYAQIQFEQISPLTDPPHNSAPFTGIYIGSIAFADVDGDGDQDVLITGDSDSGSVSELYSNDGFGTYSLVTGTPFPGVEYSSIAFADVDGDADQDVFITGDSDSGPISELYLNDGSGTYTLVDDAPFIGVYASSIAFSDVDGDGDQDVLITGVDAFAISISRLYLNNGFGIYSLVGDTPFTGVYHSSIAFADVDGDDDQDVLITGLGISELYLNDGSGIYIVVSDTPFPSVFMTSIAFADVDGDGDQDVLITGGYSSSSVSRLYLNDGSGTYILVPDSPFDSIKQGSIAFADVDGDGDQDVLITGSSFNDGFISKLYSNDGCGAFELVEDMPFTGVVNSSIAFADIDGDGDQDVLITGSISTTANRVSKLYRNTSLSCEITPACEDFSLTLDESGSATLLASDIDDGSTVTCGIPLLSMSQSEFTCDDVGEHDIELTVTDDNGNSETCLASVTVVPGIACVSISNLLNFNNNQLSDCSYPTTAVEFYEPGTSILVQVMWAEFDMEFGYVLAEPLLGIFDVYITVPGALQESFLNLEIIEGDNNVDMSQLRYGDLNGSNGVNISDVSTLIAAFGSTQGEVNYNSIADFNCDGSVNIIDVSILSSSFGMVGDSPPIE